ncbi:hypothetical protein [Streptomyces sp. NPDC127190]|uniref:hypothetical protein n=1 Tax=unclassified Streptomyces TaxID=2593676 RepID=UPI003643B97A
MPTSSAGTMMRRRPSHDTVLRWSMHLGTSTTRPPGSALRAMIELVDLHVIAL